MSERLTLLEKPAGADAELEAPTREDVDCYGLLRQRDRVGGDERHDRDAESQTLGRRGDEPKRDHCIRPRRLCVPRWGAVGPIRITRLE